MSSRGSGVLRRSLGAFLIFAVVLMLPLSAPAFSGGPHQHAAEKACDLFTYRLGDPDFGITRDATVPLYPQLLETTTWFVDAQPGIDETEQRTNREWIRLSSSEADYHETVYDGYTSGSAGTTTYTHFWETEDGLRDHVEGMYDNAWEKSELLWFRSVNLWWQGGYDGSAYSNLAYVIHLCTDMGQPAHVHSDLHGPGNDDSLEEAMSATWADAHFDWLTPLGVAGPQDVFQPERDNQGIVNTIIASGWSADEMADSDPSSGDPYLCDVSTYGMYNMPQLFRVMYTVNETACFFASDGAEGDTADGIGWLGGYASYPADFWHLTGDDSDNDNAWDEMDNNDTECPVHPDPVDETTLCGENSCDCDGDLTRIAMTGYGASFKAAPAVLDLFRRTIDDVPPVSTIEKHRADLLPIVEWNNSPVVVTITGAEDHGRMSGIGELRASGVWQRWLTCDEASPGIQKISVQYQPDGTTPYWVVNKDGKFDVRLMSTDRCGNVEGPANDFAVWVDLTPPEVTFPALRPNYLTSEDFVATWNAWDATSGVDEETAYLDNHIIGKGEVVDLSDKAGRHTLRVIAYDKAGNWTDVTYEFEVWIDAFSMSKPVGLNEKSNGGALFAEVQFPEPYDVGTIDLATARLSVKGWLELEASFPIMEPSARLSGDKLTGVANGGDWPTRGIRFDREAFLMALEDDTGPITSVVWGTLDIEGSPRYVAPLGTFVFSPPKAAM